MKRRSSWILSALALPLILAVVFVPLSKAQVARISRGALLLPKKLLSLPPKVLGGAMLQSPVMPAATEQASNNIVVAVSYHNDTSPPLRDIKQLPIASHEEGEANENPKLPTHHKDSPDEAVGRDLPVSLPSIPSPTLNFDGIPYPGVGCFCAPPDTNGEVGLTQYVQIVNEGYQVFNKTTGASVLGPSGIETIWSGFGGVCETAGHGDPVMLYDQLANRWVISQFAGSGVPTDECVAVSVSSDATGSYNRYGFHLGSDFFDYPKLSVWPDAYYMSMNVFNSSGTAFLGPQPFAFDRAKMLAGQPATFVSTGITGGALEDSYLPADLDGSTLPTAGAPATFVEWPGSGAYRVFHFHADFAVPANSTFTLVSSPAAAGFTELCPLTRACVPQLGVSGSSNLDGIGDRLMHRLAYRNFGAFESVVGNFTVSSGGVAGIRWFELRNVTAGPVTVFQESTYQPDTDWRWMGSAAQDHQGNLALGFSASSTVISPQIRYAGRLVTDPTNTLAQGEAHLIDGTGSQLTTANRWGDYSALSVDPVDDCTFWYTQEYYSTTGSFNWRTRIGNFKFPGCSIGPPTPTVTGTPPTNTPTPTPTNTPTPTPTVCPGANYTISQTSGTIALGTTDTGNHCDDCDTLVTLPFPFKLYDQTFSTVNVSSNGRLDFVTNNDPGGYLTSCLPAPPHNGPFAYTIFPLWHDLRTDAGLSGCSAWTNGCGIFTSTSGSAPTRIFNIEFHTVRFGDNTQTQQFEVRLYEGSLTQRFDAIYGAINGVIGADTGGAQGPTPLLTQAFCNTTAPSNILHTYTLAGGCTTPSPTPTNTPTGTRTNTPTSTPTNTPTNAPTNTPTVTQTNTPTRTPTTTPTNTPTNTPINAPTNTPTFTPTNTPTRTPTTTPTNTPTNTPTPTDTRTVTPTSTPTNTRTNTPTSTTTNTPTNTPTPVVVGTGKIADSSTTCAVFRSGSFTAVNTIGYKANPARIKTVSPSGFSYFSRVTGSFNANDAITIVQTDNSANGTPFFAAQSPVSLFSAADCSTSTANVTITTGNPVTIKFNGTFSGDLIIGVNYSTAAVVGAAPPSPATVHYGFVTTATGTVVDHNTNGLDLAPR
jgi:hypothetical protein